MTSVLIFTFLSNNTEYADSRAIGFALEKAGVRVSYAALKTVEESHPLIQGVASYTAVLIPVQVAALHNSTPRKYAVLKKVFTEAKRLVCFSCDTTMRLDPHSWIPGESRETRLNLYNLQPIHYAACFRDEIQDDEEAVGKLENLWLRKSHPESSLNYVEWTAFHVDRFPLFLREIKGKLPVDKSLHHGEPINRFYYGAWKPKVAKSLKECGFGEEGDAVFGSIAKGFPELPNLRPNRVKDADYLWLTILDSAERVMIPYEPLKGDYQMTLRMMESLLLYGGKAEIDPHFNSALLPFFTSLDAWRRSAEVAKERLVKLIEE